MPLIRVFAAGEHAEYFILEMAATGEMGPEISAYGIADLLRANGHQGAPRVDEVLGLVARHFRASPPASGPSQIALFGTFYRVPGILRGHLAFC